MSRNTQEGIIVTCAENVQVEFASILQKKILAVVALKRKEDNLRNIWDTLNEQYVEDLSCIIADIILEKVSFKSFSEDGEFHKKLIDPIVNSVIERAQISSELDVILFEELAKSGVEKGFSCIKYKIEDSEKHKQHINNMVKLGSWQLESIRSISVIIEKHLYDNAQTLIQKLFPSQYLQKNTDTDCLKDSATTVRELLDSQKIVKSLFFSLSPKRIERCYDSNLLIKASDMQNTISPTINYVNNVLGSKIKGQVNIFNNKAGKLIASAEKYYQIKKWLLTFSIGVSIILFGLGTAGLSVSFVTDLFKNVFLPLGGAVIAAGAGSLLIEITLLGNNTYKGYKLGKLQQAQKSFEEESQQTQICDLTNTIRISKHMLEAINPVLEEKRVRHFQERFESNNMITNNNININNTENKVISTGEGINYLKRLIEEEKSIHEFN